MVLELVNQSFTRKLRSMLSNMRYYCNGHMESSCFITAITCSFLSPVSHWSKFHFFFFMLVTYLLQVAIRKDIYTTVGCFTRVRQQWEVPEPSGSGWVGSTSQNCCCFLYNRHNLGLVGDLHLPRVRLIQPKMLGNESLAMAPRNLH